MGGALFCRQSIDEDSFHSDQMMKYMFVWLREWLFGKRTNYGDWRTQVGVRTNTTAKAANDSAAPPPPLGSRFRQAPAEYSMTVGQSDELNRLLKTIRPLPQGAIKVMQELNNADASAASVAEAIMCEPVMAAAIVRIANSSAIGLRRQVTAVSEAVSYLGFSITKSLLLRFNIDGVLPSSSPGKGYDSGKLWVHAMAVSQVAEELARRGGRADPNLALTGGLLHDIGKLAINSQYPESLDQLWSPDADPNEGLLNRERRLFQADHAIIGATLACVWRLPHDLSEIVRLHHTPSNLPTELPAETRRALFAVHIANQLVKYRHVYCEGMEIDLVSAEMTAELGLADWSTLLVDRSLQSITDRAVLMNGGTTEQVAAAA
jgi:putative nucleotidyltransferase with HDIG domain